MISEACELKLSVQYNLKSIFGGDEENLCFFGLTQFQLFFFSCQKHIYRLP